MNDMKEEFERALEEDALELHATVENILEEIGDVLVEEEARKERRLEQRRTCLQAQLEKISRDLAALTRDRWFLREKEKTFEQGQEGFYKTFKAAVAEVQAAKNRIGEWENRESRAFARKGARGPAPRGDLASDRTGGRRAEDFAHAQVPREMPRMRSARNGTADIPPARRPCLDRRNRPGAYERSADTESRYEFLTKESEDLEKRSRRPYAPHAGIERENKERV